MRYQYPSNNFRTSRQFGLKPKFIPIFYFSPLSIIITITLRFCTGDWIFRSFCENFWRPIFLESLCTFRWRAFKKCAEVVGEEGRTLLEKWMALYNVSLWNTHNMSKVYDITIIYSYRIWITISDHITHSNDITIWTRQLSSKVQKVCLRKLEVLKSDSVLC